MEVRVRSGSGGTELPGAGRLPDSVAMDSPGKSGGKSAGEGFLLAENLPCVNLA